MSEIKQLAAELLAI